MRLKGARKELSGVMEIVCILFGILVTWVFLFVVESLSHVCSMPGLLSLTISRSLPKFTSIESVMHMGMLYMYLSKLIDLNTMCISSCKFNLSYKLSFCTNLSVSMLLSLKSKSSLLLLTF